MAAESILDLVGDEEGWNTETKLILALEYIDSQREDEAWELFLEEHRAAHAAPDYESMTPQEYAEAICHTCGQLRSVCTGREGDTQ